MFVFLYILLVISEVVTYETSLHQGPKHLQILCDTPDKQEWLYSLSDYLDIGRFPRSCHEPIDIFIDPTDIPWFEYELQIRHVSYNQPNHYCNPSHSRLPPRRKRRLAAAGALNLTTFPRYDEVKAYMKYLETVYPDLVTYFSIGKSSESRDIVGVKISNGRVDKPAVFIDAGIHAREWIAPTSALYAIKQLVENVTNWHLVDDVDVYIVPILNPDGYDFTHLHNTTRFWRKTRSKTGSTFCYGVDANRNFDIEWNTIGSSNNPCTDNYAGPNAFSEPETRALRDFIFKRKDRIKAYITLHSYGNYILYPWGFTSDVPKHEALLKCVANKAKDELTKIRGTQYRIGSSTNVLYPAAGGSDDWAMGVAGIELAYTMELPGGIWGFAPPPDEIHPVGEETFEAIKVFIGYVKGDVCSELKFLIDDKSKNRYVFY